MDWNDRSTCVLFGDGAGAAVLALSEDEESAGIIGMEQGADGAKGMVLACQDRKNNNPLVKNSTDLKYTYMDGQEVYKFAVTTAKEAMEKARAKREAAEEKTTAAAGIQPNINFDEMTDEEIERLTNGEGVEQ